MGHFVYVSFPSPLPAFALLLEFLLLLLTPPSPAAIIDSPESHCRYDYASVQSVATNIF